jgi:hypothetical protein
MTDKDNIVTISEHPLYKSRRRLLQMAGATAVGASTVPVFTRNPALSANLPPTASQPPAVGIKFGRDGHVLPLPGNTLVCHLAQQGAEATCFNALLDIYREAPAHAFMHKVTLTPPSSYHMTVFGAATGSDRCAGLWPADLQLDAPMPVCHRLIASKLREFRLDCALPFRLRVDLSEPEADHLPLRIRLLPVDDAENKKLRSLRDRLSQALSIRGDDHDTYEFHITLGYLIRWLTSEENTTFRIEMKRWRETVAKRCPVIELGSPEFCTFEDMFAFERQFYLS